MLSHARILLRTLTFYPVWDYYVDFCFLFLTQHDGPVFQPLFLQISVNILCAEHPSKASQSNYCVMVVCDGVVSKLYENFQITISLHCTIEGFIHLFNYYAIPMIHKLYYCSLQADVVLMPLQTKASSRNSNIERTWLENNSNCIFKRLYSLKTFSSLIPLSRYSWNIILP